MSRECPGCNTPLDFSPPLEINQQVICTNCGLVLEVIWLYPLELARVRRVDPDTPRKLKHPQKEIKRP